MRTRFGVVASLGFLWAGCSNASQSAVTDGSSGDAPAADAGTIDTDADADAVAVTVDPSLPVLGTAIAKETYAIQLGAVATIFQPPTATGLASFPSAMTVETADSKGNPSKKIFVGFSEADDKVSAATASHVLASTDLGRTFADLPYDTSFMSVLNSARTWSGGLVLVPFKGASSGTKLNLPDGFISADLGVTWTHKAVSFTATKPIGGAYVHRGILELADTARTLLATIYVNYTGQTGHHVDLLQSTNGGVTWTTRSTIGGFADRDLNETTVARVADGSLLAVMRASVPDSADSVLWSSRSKDDGKTWSTLTPVKIGAASTQALGVDPNLLLLPNGALVLAYGRPDNWVAISNDGTGETWDETQITYVNYPSQGLRTHGSSGYSAFAQTDSNETVLIGDNCASNWGCPANESGFTIDSQQRIWQRDVHVGASDPGRLDLAAKVRAGLVHVTTNLSGSSAAHPETRAFAAFDGSTAPWSSAIAQNTGGKPLSFVVELDRAYDLTRVGVSVGNGRSGRADVYASEDGVHWTAHLATAGLAPHYAMERFALASPVHARFVLVRLESKTDCTTDITAACGVLSELELSTTLDAFDDDALGVAPRQFSKTSLALVAGGSYDGSRALELEDESTTELAHVERTTAPSAHKTLEFRVLAQKLTGGLLFDVLGSGATAHHLAFFGDGSLHAYDDASAQWSSALTPAGALAVNRWTTVQVAAELGKATIAIDGKVVATAPSTATGISSLNGFAFSSSGTPTIGDRFLIDDVGFTDP
ncbi:MAG: exo-alpha-sialidase [Polyangiaceae bacterium]